MMMWHLYCINPVMFNPSVKRSSPAQGLMQILCLTVFWLSALTLPSGATAQTNSAAESMGLQVRQWMAQTHGVKEQEVVIAPLDSRLKIQGCQKSLNVDHPFASKEAVRVRCPDPVWQLYLQVTMPVARTNTPPVPSSAGVQNPVAPQNSGATQNTNSPPNVAKTIVVARRLLQRGVILQPDMLEEVQASPGIVDTQLLSSLKDAQQAELTRDITAGQALRVSDIRRAVMVKQGQSVMLSIGNKSEFQISIRMEAMQDGRLGEQVKLKNPETGRQVSGVVTGLNTAKGL
jgi:flagella basal body P-ring formation protein FlgA